MSEETKDAPNFFLAAEKAFAAVVPEQVQPSVPEEIASEAITETASATDEIFPRKEKKTPVTKEESMAELRRQRDEERRKNQFFIDKLGDADVDSIRPFIDYIKEVADGPINPQSAEEIITRFKTQQEEISRLSLELEEKERKVTDLDIRYSDSFKNQFEKPYSDSLNSLFLEFANVSPDKSVIAPNATKAFHDFLVANPNIEGLDVKAKLSEFAKMYRDESGEEPSLPSVTSLMSSLREFRSKRSELEDAYKNWTTKKAEAERAKQESESQSQSEREKAAKKRRTELASKAFRDFDTEKLSFVDESDIQSMFKEEFQFTEDIYSGKDVPTHDVMFQRGVKARLWDKYADQLPALIKFKEDFEKSKRSTLNGSSPSGLIKDQEVKLNWGNLLGK